MNKTINISIKEDYLEKFDNITKREYSDRSKMLRKWIDAYFEKNIDNNSP